MLAAGDDGAALLGGEFDGVMEAPDGGVGDQRADERALGERVADSDRPIGGGESFDEAIGDGLVEDEAADGGAALPGGADGAEDHGLEGEVEVGGLIDDAAVVTAEFEDRADRQASGDDLTDMLAHAHRTGRGDERNAAVCDESFADDGIGADEQAEDAGVAKLRCDAIGELVGGDGGKGREERGLPEDDVAADGREHGVPKYQTALGKLKAEMTPTGPAGATARSCGGAVVRWAW